MNRKEEYPRSREQARGLISTVGYPKCTGDVRDQKAREDKRPRTSISEEPFDYTWNRAKKCLGLTHQRYLEQDKWHHQHLRQ